MNLFELAKNIDYSGFNPEPAVSNPDHSGFGYWNAEPVPDFAERIPETLLIPDGKPYFISQSLIKAFRKMAADELCPKRFYHTNLTREYNEEAGDAAKMGTRFEYLLTGNPGRNGDGNQPILTERGKEGADEKRIQQNAQTALSTLKRLGFRLSQFQVGKKAQFKCLRGEYDLYNPETIVDIKYSGLIGDSGKWNELGWYEIAQKFSHICQSNHYLLISQLNGLNPNFYFAVFDNRAGKEGEYRAFQMKPSESILNQHKNLILYVIDHIQHYFNEGGFTAVPTYDFCKNCPVKTCESRVNEPGIIEISY